MKELIKRAFLPLPAFTLVQDLTKDLLVIISAGRQLLPPVNKTA